MPEFQLTGSLKSSPENDAIGDMMGAAHINLSTECVLSVDQLGDVRNDKRNSAGGGLMRLPKHGLLEPKCLLNEQQTRSFWSPLPTQIMVTHSVSIHPSAPAHLTCSLSSDQSPWKRTS